MPRQTGLLAAVLAESRPYADRLEVAADTGWSTRGSPTFAPSGCVDHHTASSRRGGPFAALGICRSGRAGLPGPLCHVHASRPLAGGKVRLTVLAAGRANHAGTGGYRGLSGNSTVWGLECENDGIGEPWHPNLLLAVHVFNAAVLRLSGRSEVWACDHQEWTPRKIDISPSMHTIRTETGRVLAGAAPSETVTGDDVERAAARARDVVLGADAHGQGVRERLHDMDVQSAQARDSSAEALRLLRARR